MCFCRIEETWRLWQKFLDDYSRFEEWLKVSERTAALPNSSGVLYTVAKEELKKFEVFWDPQRESLGLRYWVRAGVPNSSPRASPLCTVCISLFNNTPDSDHRLHDQVRPDWQGPYEVFTVPYSLSMWYPLKFTLLDKMRLFAKHPAMLNTDESQVEHIRGV